MLCFGSGFAFGHNRICLALGVLQKLFFLFFSLLFVGFAALSSFGIHILQFILRLCQNSLCVVLFAFCIGDRIIDLLLALLNHVSTPQAIRALGRGLVDLCVITTPARLESTMRRTLLMPFQEILIAGRDFEFLQGRRWALKELQQYPLICLGSETMTYAFYNQFYLSNNLVLQPDTEAATTDQVVPLVKSGLGLGYVPQNFAKDALAAGDVFTIQLKEEIPTRHVVLVQDGGRVPNAAAREFARMLNSSVTQQNAP